MSTSESSSVVTSESSSSESCSKSGGESAWLSAASDRVAESLLIESKMRFMDGRRPSALRWSCSNSYGGVAGEMFMMYLQYDSEELEKRKKSREKEKERENESDEFGFI